MLNRKELVVQAIYQGKIVFTNLKLTHMPSSKNIFYHISERVSFVFAHQYHKQMAVAILPSMAIYPQRLFCRELFVIGQS